MRERPPVTAALKVEGRANSQGMCAARKVEEIDLPLQLPKRNIALFSLVVLGH